MIRTLTAANSSEVDITDELEAAFAIGDMVELRGGNWRFTRNLQMSPGAALVGVHNPKLRISGPVLATAIMVSSGCVVEGLTINADKASKPWHYAYTFDVTGFRNRFEKLTILNPLSEAFRIYGGHNTLRHLAIQDGDRSAIFIRAGVGHHLEDILFTRMAHFGVHAYSSERCSLVNLRTFGSGLELIALLEDTWGYRVMNCHAEGTGDNGISIGGHSHVVEGNHVRRNDHDGICLFGRDNTCVGNFADGNNVRRSRESWPTFAGISVSPAFGSLGRRNVIDGNWLGDTQAVATQHAGLFLRRNMHLRWAAGEVINPSNPYRSLPNFQVWKALNTIPVACGTTPPSGSGLDDAGLNWRLVASGGTHLDAVDNAIGNNVFHRNTSGTALSDSPRQVL